MKRRALLLSIAAIILVSSLPLQGASSRRFIRLGPNTRLEAISSDAKTWVYEKDGDPYARRYPEPEFALRPLTGAITGNDVSALSPDGAIAGGWSDAKAVLWDLWRPTELPKLVNPAFPNTSEVLSLAKGGKAGGDFGTGTEIHAFLRTAAGEVVDISAGRHDRNYHLVGLNTEGSCGVVDTTNAQITAFWWSDHPSKLWEMPKPDGESDTWVTCISPSGDAAAGNFGNWAIAEPGAWDVSCVSGPSGPSYTFSAYYLGRPSFPEVPDATWERGYVSAVSDKLGDKRYAYGGIAYTDSYYLDHGFAARWTISYPRSGAVLMERMQQVLESQGFAFTGWSLGHVQCASLDNNIVGILGTNPQGVEESVIVCTGAYCPGEVKKLNPILSYVKGRVSAVFPDCVYIQADNRANGIQVRLAAGAEGLAVGDEVGIDAELETNQSVDAERFIVQVQNTPISRTPGPAPVPLLMPPRCIGGGDFFYDPVKKTGQRGASDGIGLSNTGLFVKTFGRVTEVGSGYFVLDGVLTCKADFSLPPTNVFVKACGISCLEKVGTDLKPFLRLRTAADLEL